jgi:hypothetical protein
MSMAKKITAELFGLEIEDLNKINESNMEEVVYEFGNVQYKLGRLETDGRDSDKVYNKLLKRKEELSKIIDKFFN